MGARLGGGGTDGSANRRCCLCSGIGTNAGGGVGGGIAASAGDQSSITFGLGFKNGSLTFCFGVVGSKGGVSLTLGDAALAFGFGLGSNLNLLLRNFLTSDFLCTQALTFKFVLSLFNFDLSLTLGDF